MLASLLFSVSILISNEIVGMYEKKCITLTAKWQPSINTIVFTIIHLIIHQNYEL